MGFLSGLFKKKAGGTFAGNLLRKVVSRASYGLLGQGRGMLPLETDTDLLGDNSTDYWQGGQRFD